MIVRKSITMRELVKKVHQITKINPNEHQIHLTCKWPVAHGPYQAVGISDDDDTHVMPELFPVMNTIEFYVEKDSVSHQMHEGHREFTRMHNLDNESMGFKSPVHNT